MNTYRKPLEVRVSDLLAECELPTSDLSPRHFEHFFACGPLEAPAGVVGLELYDTVALLRSLAVSAKSRGNGYGKELVAQAERYAQSQGVREIYLLTTTAEEFFERLGYKRTNRESAPSAIRRTEEFSALCPSTSAFMVKTLPSNSVLSTDAILPPI
jgi:amino-acid N-acetyltransferase